MDQIDRFERPDQHLEVDDLLITVPANNVNAIDYDAVDLGNELQNGSILIAPLVYIFKRAAKENGGGRIQISRNLGLPFLRCVYDWRMKNGILSDLLPVAILLQLVCLNHAVLANSLPRNAVSAVS